MFTVRELKVTFISAAAGEGRVNQGRESRELG
jgi:hypothetical protein